MATAGYDPRAALDLWELMSCVEKDAVMAGQAVAVENKFALLRTHPTSETRQAALQVDIKKAMGIWEEHRPRKRPATSSTQQPRSSDEKMTISGKAVDPVPA